MKSGKPLVLVVSHRSTLKHRSLRGSDAAKTGAFRDRGQRHLRLVAAGGVSVDAPAASQPVMAGAERLLSRPLGRRVRQAANDVAVLALALISGIYPRA